MYRTIWLHVETAHWPIRQHLIILIRRTPRGDKALTNRKKDSGWIPESDITRCNVTTYCYSYQKEILGAWSSLALMGFNIWGCQIGSFGAKKQKFGSFEKRLTPKFLFGYLATFWLFCNFFVPEIFLGEKLGVAHVACLRHNETRSRPLHSCATH